MPTKLNMRPVLQSPDPVFYDELSQSQEPWSMYSSGLPQAANETLITPGTTIPSITSEAFHTFLPLPVNDFVGKGRPSVQLEYELDAVQPAQELATAVEEGFRVHSTNEAGRDGAISGLQKTLSFNLKQYGKMPATSGQLSVFLQRSRLSRGVPANSSITPEDFVDVLNLYGDHARLQFQLGVVSRVYDSSYRVGLHRIVPYRVPTLWLFYDENGEDTGLPQQWSAIIPYDNPSRPSYAAAVAAPPPQPIRPPPFNNGPNPAFLHVGYTPSHSRNNSVTQQRRPPTAPRSVSNRSQRGNRQQGSRQNRARRSNQTSRTPSEVGGPITEKPHKCLLCGRAFLYPKDLRRHATTHSGCKEFRCTECTKSFTRKDNLHRHLRDDHPGFTPPGSVATSG